MLRKLLLATVLVGVFSATVSAASIYSTCLSVTCSFNMNGNTTVTTGTIDWFDVSGLIANLFSFSGGTGVFAAIPANSQESIQNLTLATEPVDTLFGPDAFIAFPTNPSFPGLEINFIAPGVFSTATCGGAPANGQTCTPALPIAGNPPGPFSFINTVNPATGAIQSSATFVFSGVTADGAARWNGIYSAQFLVPFQTVLGDLATTGHVSAAYSAVDVVIGIPEPGTMAMFIGGGLISISLLLRRRYANKRT